MNNKMLIGLFAMNQASGYTVTKSSKRWNPSWEKPDSVELDKDGTMYVWYLDGSDEEIGSQKERTKRGKEQ